MSGVIDSKDVEDSLFILEKEILSHNKPNSWNIHDENNLERQIEVDFAKYSISVANHSGMNVNDLDVFTFYAIVEKIEDELKPKKNGQRNNKL